MFNFELVDWSFQAGLWRSVFSHGWSIVLILAGLAGIGVGVLGIVQTRRWPPSEVVHETPEDEAEEGPARTTVSRPKQKASDAASSAPMPKEVRGSPVRIELAQIDERHPDVWAHDEPLQVEVQWEPALARRDGECVLLLHRHKEAEEVARAPADPGAAAFTLPPPGKGEMSIVVRVEGDDASEQNARVVRFVDYRAEIVETFEDFEKWAHTHYSFPRRSLTAREFVDRYADRVPGTPVPPLDQIVDVYELANYSDHPVDRARYLELVEAFLELEEAGALEGPQEET